MARHSFYKYHINAIQILPYDIVYIIMTRKQTCICLFIKYKILKSANTKALFKYIHCK